MGVCIAPNYSNCIYILDVHFFISIIPGFQKIRMHSKQDILTEATAKLLLTEKVC